MNVKFKGSGLGSVLKEENGIKYYDGLASFIYRFTLFSEMGCIVGLKVSCQNGKSDAETGNWKFDNALKPAVFPNFKFQVSLLKYESKKV